jgi:hypothetical protein
MIPEARSKARPVYTVRVLAQILKSLPGPLYEQALATLLTIICLLVLLTDMRPPRRRQYWPYRSTRRSVAALPPRQPGFDPWSSYVVFAVNKVALRGGFSPSTAVSPASCRSASSSIFITQHIRRFIISILIHSLTSGSTYSRLLGPDRFLSVE